MGSFWIWLLCAIFFGLLCSVLFLWLDKSDETGLKKTLQEHFTGSAVVFTIIGLVIIGVLSLIFAD